MIKKKEKISWFLANENYGANLCPFAFHFDADYHGFVKEYGRGMNYEAIGTENGFFRQAYGIEDYNSFAKWFFNKLSSDKIFAKKALKNIYKAIGDFYKFNKKVSRTKLSVLNNRQLADLFEKFYQYFFIMSTWSVPFSFTEYGTLLWTNSLVAYLNTLKIPKNHSALEIYQILTSHRRKTYTARERESTLKLAIKTRKSIKLLKSFKQPAERIIFSLDREEKNFLREIKKHAKKYAWLSYGFEGPLLDLNYFVMAIKDYIRKKNPQKELTDIKNNLKILESKQKDLIKRLEVDEKHKWMFWVVKEFGFQKALRKDIEYHSYYVYEILLKELGQRLHISIKQGHYLLKDEIVDILLDKKKVDVDEINKRIKCNFYVVIKGRAKLLVGREAKNFIRKIKSESVPKNLKELNGQCAYHGKIIGRVKIIKNKEEYNKFKTGDILVSYATNPNMVPLMKKSSAIITDEGGITCHAAIVSRELRIPCVIGTRYATKILKDGNKVEVNANKGMVKILE